MAMMISWVAPVHPSPPYLENDPAPPFVPTICAFHRGFGLGGICIYEALGSKLRAGVPLLGVNCSSQPFFGI